MLYKLGRYADAKIYIDQTLKFSTDSTADNTGDSTSDNTLYEHAAEIYAKLGDYKAAADFCKQAIKHGGEAKALEKKMRMYQKMYQKKTK